MAKQAVTESDVRWAHRFLRLTTPYEAMPPQLRAAVTAAASALAPSSGGGRPIRLPST